MNTLSLEAKTSLSVSPPKLQFSVPRGSQLPLTITVSNPGGKTVQLRYYITDLAQGSGNTVILLKGKQALSRWFKRSAGKFTLKPAETKRVNFHLSVPTTVKPAQYRAIVFFEANSANRSGAGVTNRIGTLVSVTVTKAVVSGKDVVKKPNPRRFSTTILILVTILVLLLLLGVGWLVKALKTAKQGKLGAK
jgi:hypothetical protein